MAAAVGAVVDALAVAAVVAADALVVVGRVRRGLVPLAGVGVGQAVVQAAVGAPAAARPRHAAGPRSAEPG